MSLNNTKLSVRHVNYPIYMKRDAAYCSKHTEFKCFNELQPKKKNNSMNFHFRTTNSSKFLSPTASLFQFNGKQINTTLHYCFYRTIIIKQQ